MSPEVINLLEESIDSSISESDSIVDSDWFNCYVKQSIYCWGYATKVVMYTYKYFLFLVKISPSDHEVLTSEIAMK